MTDRRESDLLCQAWQARLTLYEELFGAHAYSLPRNPTPPRVPVPGLRGRVDDMPASDLVVGSDGASAGTLVFAPAITAKHIDIMAYGPAPGRDYWMYVTSGLSNPWFQPRADEVSGFGCEIMIKAQTDAAWPLRLLRRLAAHISSYTGTLSPGVILQMKSPIGAACADALDNIFIWYADEAPDCLYQLPSGAFGVFVAVGITEDECCFAESVKQYGTWCIQQVLRNTGVGQITKPGRQSVMKGVNISGVLESVRAYAENFDAAPGA